MPQKDSAERLASIFGGFTSYCLSMGWKREQVLSWINMSISVYEHVESTYGHGEPNNQERMRELIRALCWWAPSVGVTAYDLRQYAQDHIDSLEDIHGMFSDLSPPCTDPVWAQLPNSEEGGVPQ